MGAALSPPIALRRVSVWRRKETLDLINSGAVAAACPFEATVEPIPVGAPAAAAQLRTHDLLRVGRPRAMASCPKTPSKKPRMRRPRRRRRIRPRAACKPTPRSRRTAGTPARATAPDDGASFRMRPRSVVSLIAREVTR